MGNVRGMSAWAVLAAATTWSCGGGSSGSGSLAQFDALKTQYTSPTASLSAADLPAIETALTNGEEGSSVPIATATRRPGARSLGDPITCSVGGTSESCACNGGGSVSVSVDVASNGEGGNESYNHCVIDDSGVTETIDGSISFAVYDNPLVDIYSGSITETVTPPGTTITVDLDYALVNDELTYNVSVSDGNLLIQDTGSWDPTTDSGSFTLIDRNTTWSCTLTNGTGSCTGSNGSTVVF